MIRGVKKFKFGTVRQDRGDKHLRLGDLLVAKNVRQTLKAGVYGKRRGMVRTEQTFVGGSISGTVAEVLPGENGNTFMRDTGDQVWQRSQSTNAWTLLGTHTRPWIETTTTQSGMYADPKPFCALVGSNLWTFALSTNAYEFTITSLATREVLYSKTTTTSTGIVHGSAVYDGTYVWVFWVDNGSNGIVRAHRYTPAAPKTAPVATNYVSFGTINATYATLKLQQVQARYMSAIDRVFVVACGGEKPASNYLQAVCVSCLVQVTGLADTVTRPARIDWTINNAAGFADTTSYCGSLCIPEGQDGSAANWYYFFVHGNTATTGLDTVRYKVATATFAAAAFLNCTAINTSGTVGAAVVSMSGFVDNTGNGKQYLIVTTKETGAALPAWSMVGMVDDTTSSISTGVARGDINLKNSWIASGFAQYNGNWWFITGYDDRKTGVPETSTVQRCYHVRKFITGANAAACSTQIFGQALVGDAPANNHLPAADITITPPAWPATNVPTLVLYSSANVFSSFLAVRGVMSGTVDIAIMRIEMAKVYGKGDMAMGRAFFPGNIPVSAGNGIAPHEVAPLLNPELVNVTGGSGTDFSIVAVVYAIYNNDGTIWRSAPKVVSQTIGNGANIRVYSPLFYFGGTSQVCTELYLGVNGTAKLQKVYPPYVSGPVTYNDFTTPTVANLIDGEILYTTGNALSSTWPVACQAIGAWNNRLFFAQKNRVWVSKELEPGFGPLFSESQVSPWNDEPGEITAIGPVDWNYLAIASTGQVAVASGAGPDGVGSGNYIFKTLPSRTGVAAGSQMVQGPGGAYIQTSTTGRIVVVTPALQVQDAAPGADDYSPYSFTSAAWYETEGLVVFYSPAQNTMVVIDYQHPVEVAPFGLVYVWTFSKLLTLSRIQRDDYGLMAIDTTGNVYRPGNQWVDDRSGGTATYQMDIITAPLQVDDMQGEFTVAFLQVLATMRGVSGMSITTFPGYASLTASDPRTATTSITLPAPTNTGDTESIATRPPHCARIQAMSVRVLEAAGITSQSFEFEGLAIDYTATGKLLRPRGARII